MIKDSSTLGRVVIGTTKLKVFIYSIKNNFKREKKKQRYRELEEGESETKETL